MCIRLCARTTRSGKRGVAGDSEPRARTALRLSDELLSCTGALGHNIPTGYWHGYADLLDIEGFEASDCWRSQKSGGLTLYAGEP